MTASFHSPHQANEARVIPIVLRPVDWKGAPFAHLQALPTDAKAITTWGNWDAAFTNVAAGIRRVIEDLSSLQASAPRAALPPVWNVPYPRNSFFIGRGEILARLRTQLQTGQATALSQPQAITGLGVVCLITGSCPLLGIDELIDEKLDML